MGRIPILVYHSLDLSGSVVSVPPQVFAQQMASVADLGFRGIPLRAAVEARTARGRWPERHVVITFDDGFANVHSEALPVMQQHQFAATVFLVSDYVGRLNEWETPPKNLGVQPLMTWEQANELGETGWEIGAHTRTHPDLRRLNDARIADEILASRSILEQRLGRAVESFAYPYGHFDARTLRIVAREYRAACTNRLQWVADDSLHLLPRIDAYYITDAAMLRRLLRGRLDGYLTFRRFGRRLRQALTGDRLTTSA